MTKQQRVSVIIPTYNAADFVARAVTSVLSQTVPPAEVIVVDDGSTDDTLAALQTFGSAIRVLPQENRGVAAARNAGFEASTGDCLAFLDADDVWLPRKLEAQLQALSSAHGIGLVGCGIREVDETGRVLRLRTEGQSGWVSRELLLLKHVLPIPGSSALIPRSVLEEVGSFDERLSTSADWELCLRIAMRYRFAFVPEPLVDYTIRAGAMHWDVSRLEHDVLLGYEKAFSRSPELAGSLRRQALASLFMTVGASHFRAGRPLRASGYVARGLALDPEKARYVLGFPRRWVSRYASAQR